MNDRANIIIATCTPLGPDERLAVEGLERHMEDLASAGISSLLIGGTMGLMQLLTDRTYLELVEQAVRISAGRFELLVGVGDTSFVRTRDRIRMVDRLGIDGVVVLTPYFIRYRPEELVSYYRTLAGVSRRPVYLYTNPEMTGVDLALETVVQAAGHPNIHGIKCACNYEWTEQLRNAIDDTKFRIIVARPDSVDVLIRAGVREHLDGVFSLAPHWTTALAEAAQKGDWKKAAEYQSRISGLLSLVRDKYPTYASFTAILTARGISGTIGPAPFRQLTTEERERLLNEPLVRELLASAQIHRAKKSPVVGTPSQSGHKSSRHAVPSR